MIADRTHPAATERPGVVVVVEPLLVPSALAGAVVGISARSWQRLTAAGETPASVRLGRKRLWALDELTFWASLGCPTRERFEAISTRSRQAEAR